LRAQHGAVAEELYAACRYFAVERWEFAQPVERTTTRERFELLIVLSGRGRVESGGEAAAYGPAEPWFLPAGLGAYRLAPETPTTLLRAYVPDLDEMARGFSERGIDRAQWARVVHT